PEQPVWQVNLDNLSDTLANADVQIVATAPDGETQTKSLKATLSPDSHVTLESALAPRMYGLHDVVTTVTLDGNKGTYTHAGKFVQLPPEERKASATTTHWGLWNWNG